MQLQRSKLQQIPQRNKDLTFGYVKDHEKACSISITQMIKYLCLVYLNPNKDKFDPDWSHSNIQIIENKARCNKWSYVVNASTSYLENIASKGVHIWRFKCNEIHGEDQIGIRKIEDDSIPALDKYFDTKSNSNAHESAGYGFGMNGFLSDPNNPQTWGHLRYLSCNIRNDDIIEIMLDFNELSLCVRVNNNDYIEAFKVENTKYKAVISMAAIDSCYTLLTYQQIL